MSYEKIKVIAFDCFGTVYDMASIDRDEIRAYAGHVRRPTYSPLFLPDNWSCLSAHSDSSKGIRRLKLQYQVVTMSNAPKSVLEALSLRNNVWFDQIIDIAERKVFKPHPKSYLMICDVCHVLPEEVLMVTANPTFGDLEGASSIGMRTQIIRRPDYPREPATIIELAERMRTWTAR